MQVSKYKMIDFGITPSKQKELEDKFNRLNIKDNDIIEKFIHSSGNGGQNVNKVSTCVYLKYIPLNIEIKCQKSRTQLLNRYYARKMLAEEIENRILGEKSKKQKEIEKFESYSKDQKILLEIKVDENSTIDENELSCVSLEEFNENQQNKEILFFPFSCFSIAAIEEDRNFDKKIILKYLSSKEIEIENEEEVGVTSFKKDFIGSNIADRKKTKEFDESLQNYENTATAQFKINKKEINQEIKLINPENNEIKDNVIISLDTSRFK